MSAAGPHAYCLLRLQPWDLSSSIRNRWNWANRTAACISNTTRLPMSLYEAGWGLVSFQFVVFF